MPNSKIDTEFELGKAFDGKTPAGKDCKSTITAVNKMSKKQEKGGFDWRLFVFLGRRRHVADQDGGRRQGSERDAQVHRLRHGGHLQLRGDRGQGYLQEGVGGCRNKTVEILSGCKTACAIWFITPHLRAWILSKSHGFGYRALCLVSCFVNWYGWFDRVFLIMFKFNAQFIFINHLVFPWLVCNGHILNFDRWWTIAFHKRTIYSCFLNLYVSQFLTRRGISKARP